MGTGYLFWRILSYYAAPKRKRVSLMSREFQDNMRYRGPQNAVATTWIVSRSRYRSLIVLRPICCRSFPVSRRKTSTFALAKQAVSRRDGVCDRHPFWVRFLG